MREVVLDTETTGLDPGAGHRIVDIGCVELAHHMATGRTFQRYLNPEREMPQEALAIHGLSDKFLAGQPLFAEMVDDFLEFLGESPLVIHNADFDLGFIDTELARLGRPPLPRHRVVDTVRLARSKFPGAQASLDALCKRFRIELAERTLHGALKDCRLLADVYLELVGGRQADLQLAANAAAAGDQAAAGGPETVRPPRPHVPTPEEEEAHARFLKKLDSPIWSA